MSRFPSIEKISHAAAEAFATAIPENEGVDSDAELENEGMELCFEAGILTSEQAEFNMHKMTAQERVNYVEQLAGQMLTVSNTGDQPTKQLYASSASGWPLLVCSSCADGDMSDPYTVAAHTQCDACKSL